MEIRPITDLRKTNEMSELCKEKNEPIFITKNGYGDMVLMSIEKYNEMTEDLLIEKAILEAEKNIDDETKYADAGTVFKELKEKYDL